jgi:membrane protease YdiL (CAAX protease family)
MGAKAACMEETLFRGDLLRALRQPLGAAGAVIISSLVFALYHLDLTPLPLVMKVAFGILFACTRLGSGSLVAGVTAHTLLWAIVAEN